MNLSLKRHCSMSTSALNHEFCVCGYCFGQPDYFNNNGFRIASPLLYQNLRDDTYRAYRSVRIVSVLCRTVVCHTGETPFGRMQNQSGGSGTPQSSDTPPDHFYPVSCVEGHGDKSQQCSHFVVTLISFHVRFLACPAIARIRLILPICRQVFIRRCSLRMNRPEQVRISQLRTRRPVQVGLERLRVQDAIISAFSENRV